ncbi:lipid-A-disaccharide synthase N-terminal domain-containing protein [Lacinutrix sp. 5H-3-7-4]|uniref:lipid-A-disaccharide synthase N-terminal domain-containing protein n=1 Tax=Lacinutrix sp. (strain 5H-3-7-4) TaxID=983544 RepID=UPI00020A3854|nr:lipid-A-disaccharide synthase N-terminal domain-containing protein [Lacinutrix sp. 5H-3-7-4]AEG99996.1 lipid A biosynthesis domain protein [Lacinutrix sp. 5H-3-7-4]
MSDWLLYGIGFLAQALFSLRLIVQWLQSEKQKKSVTPSVFWIFSLIASILLCIYGYYRDDFSIMLGQLLTYFIYIRNLQLQKVWQSILAWVRLIILSIPVIVILYFITSNTIALSKWFQNENIPQWLLVLGIASQCIFSLRFVYQWLFSEVKKQSTLPLGFWVLSSIGALLILIYAVFRNDPVLIFAHSFGLAIYFRNIYFITARS